MNREIKTERCSANGHQEDEERNCLPSCGHILSSSTSELQAALETIGIIEVDDEEECTNVYDGEILSDE